MRIGKQVDSKSIALHRVAGSSPVYRLFFLSLFSVVTLGLLSQGNCVGQEKKTAFSVKKIWDKSPHSAFTDIAKWKGEFYCAFRIGTRHVFGEDGRVQVLKSKDGDTWEALPLISKTGVDLRDPKLSVTPNGDLMVLMGGSKYEDGILISRRSYVFISPLVDKSREDKLWPGPRIQPIELEAKFATNNDWLWRVTWHDGVAYGVAYQSGKLFKGLRIFASKDGVKFEARKTLDLPGKPNEATIRFDEHGHMKIVVRNEVGGIGHLGTAQSPYTDFDWETIPNRLGGPNLIKVNNDWILGTRQYSKPARTVLGKLADDGKFTKWLELPSGGDTSYPGFLIEGNELWVTYYSSHEGKTSIYLAKVPLLSLDSKIDQ